MSDERNCSYCGKFRCEGNYGFPCAGKARAIENDYWRRTVGTTDLAQRGYRSFWD